jgi:hypothetical protein
MKYFNRSRKPKTEYISGFSLAVAAYQSKNYDKAYEFLEQAFEERASLLITIADIHFFHL